PVSLWSCVIRGNERTSLCADVSNTTGIGARSCGHHRDHPHRAAAAAEDLERCGNDNRTRRRQLIEIAEARQPELPGAVHDRMVWKRRVESSGLSRVGSDRLDADAENVAIVSQHSLRARIEAGT